LAPPFQQCHGSRGMIDPRSAARALGGDVVGRNAIVVPGPGHSPRDRSLSILFGSNGGYICHSHAGDDWQACRDYIDSALGLGRARRARRAERMGLGRRHRLDGCAGMHTHTDDRARIALQLWSEAVPLPGTLGHHYFTHHRGLAIDRLGDLSHVLRWHSGKRAVIALMTDMVTSEPTGGVHRIFLNPDGSKNKRMMLGPAGIIRLDRDEDVTTAIGLTEGVEDGSAVMLSWRPIWAAGSAGAINKFPVLSGIECLTVFADNGTPGIKAAETAVQRWESAGKEAKILPPPHPGGAQ
jgi:putative DNA primase/helicase